MKTDTDEQLKKQEKHRSLTGFWYWYVFVLSAFGLIAIIDHIFFLHLIPFLTLASGYYYVLAAVYMGIAFLLYPIRPGILGEKLFWLDACLSLLTVSIFLVFSLLSNTTQNLGWAFRAPTYMVVLSIVTWAFVIEAMRRTGNHLLLFIIIFFSIYPTFAEYMPGLLQGPGSNLQEAATFHMLTTDSVFGVPLRAVGDFAIGFIIFGVVLLNTGGGTFFINLSLAILGRSRGGPAKVAVVASGFFGSLSGSAVANVVTTGSFTIPAMIKIGYDREKAGAIEACASTGGILMPPIMGAAGFVMAAFLDIPYSAVALGAAIPSFLFYFGLFVQIDANAAKSGLKGYAASELPRLRDTLKHGWIYLVSIAVMMYFLFWLDQVGQSAFYAIVALMMLSQVYQDTRLSLGNAGKLVFQSGVFICELVVLLAGVGFILGSLTFTGVAPTFARELVRMAGDSVLLMLIFGAVASFVLGMGMTSIACYIFLAITLAPSLVAMGINEFAAHMFVLYWGIVSFITPPVAFASIAAAVIARVPAVKVGIESMKFGIVLYFIPFFFVYGPALVLQGTVAEIIRGFISAVMGTFLVASGIQGYLLGAGSFGVVQNSYLRFGLRLLLICGGVMLVFYGWFTDICGVGIALSIYLLLRARKGVCVGKHVVNGVN